MASLPIIRVLRLSLLCAMALLALGITNDNAVARPAIQPQHGLKGHYYTEGLMRDEVAYDEHSLPVAPFKQPDAGRYLPLLRHVRPLHRPGFARSQIPHNFDHPIRCCPHRPVLQPRIASTGNICLLIPRQR